mmetsp:Transcript_14442/g.31657  ORF Transcript_14442/g.31657 Transcript_14442/m.31657 type:complete len:545 (+) Transcript_14442:174-1808(+)
MDYNGGMNPMGGGYGDSMGYGGYSDVYRHNAMGPGGAGGHPGGHHPGGHPFFGMQVMAAAASAVGLGGGNVVSKSTGAALGQQQAVGTAVTTYVYRDFANVAPPADGIKEAHPNSLQARKLPAMLSSMLSDADLTSCIQWQPHGRSWRIINRDVYTAKALPAYFGHENYASFVRVVNAWGFRRIVRGPDRDSYYHELFLRGRPDLHVRMKRLSSDHRKTPQNKEDKCPDFDELSKTSPLPQVRFVSRGKIKDRAAKSGDEKKDEDNDEENPGSPEKKSPSKDGGGSMKIVEGTIDENGDPKTVQPSGSPSVQRSSGSASLLGKRSARSMEENTSDVSSANPPPQVASGSPSMNSLMALQRDNEDLRRRIVAMEMNQAGPMAGPMAGNRYHPRGPPSSMHPGLVGRPHDHSPAAMSGDVEHRLNEIRRLEADLMMMRSGSAMPAAGMGMGRPDMFAGPSSGEYRPSMDQQMMTRRSGSAAGMAMGRPGMYAGPSAGEYRSSMDQQMMARARQQGRMGGRQRVPPPPGSYYQGSSEDLPQLPPHVE